MHSYYLIHSIGPRAQSPRARGKRRQPFSSPRSLGERRRPRWKPSAVKPQTRARLYLSYQHMSSHGECSYRSGKIFQAALVGGIKSDCLECARYTQNSSLLETLSLSPLFIVVHRHQYFSDILEGHEKHCPGYRFGTILVIDTAIPNTIVLNVSNLIFAKRFAYHQTREI